MCTVHVYPFIIHKVCICICIHIICHIIKHKNLTKQSISFVVSTYHSNLEMPWDLFHWSHLSGTMPGSPRCFTRQGSGGPCKMMYLPCILKVCVCKTVGIRWMLHKMLSHTSCSTWPIQILRTTVKLWYHNINLCYTTMPCEVILDDVRSDQITSH